MFIVEMIGATTVLLYGCNLVFEPALEVAEVSCPALHAPDHHMEHLCGMQAGLPYAADSVHSFPPGLSWLASNLFLVIEPTMAIVCGS